LTLPAIAMRLSVLIVIEFPASIPRPG